MANRPRSEPIRVAPDYPSRKSICSTDSHPNAGADRNILAAIPKAGRLLVTADVLPYTREAVSFPYSPESPFRRASDHRRCVHVRIRHWPNRWNLYDVFRIV